MTSVPRWLAAALLGGVVLLRVPAETEAYQSQTSSHIWQAASVDGQGNPVLAGYDFMGPVWIARLDSQLQMTASKTFGSSWNARMGLVHDSLGYFYVANVASSLQVSVTKISPDLQTTQTSLVSGLYISNTVYNGLPLATDIAIDAQDHLYLAGQTISGNAALAQLNTSLQVLKSTTIAGSGSAASTRANRVTVDPSGLIYLTGRISSGSDYHIFVAKLDNNLTILSSSTLAVPASEGFGVRTDASGTVWLAGAANASYSACQPWIGHLNASLVLQSSATLSFQGAFFDVWPVDDHSIVASGGLGSGATDSTWIGRLGTDLAVQESFTGAWGYAGNLAGDSQGNVLVPFNNLFTGSLNRYQKLIGAPLLRGTALSNASIRWSWDASLGPDAFRLLSSTGGVMLATLPNGTTNVVEANFAVNTRYQRSLMAVGLLGSTTSSLSGIYTLANAPLNLAVAVTTGPATLQWSSSGNPSGTVYHAEITTDTVAGFTEFYAGTSNGALSSPLAHNVSYYFRVRAENGDGLLTSYSVTVSTRLTTLPPLSPTNATGTASDISSIQWTWNDRATNESGYSVRRVSDGALLAGSLPAGTTSWLQTALSPNTSAQISVAAFNDDWVSAASTAAPVFTLAAPPAGTQFGVVGSSTILLSWSANGNPLSTAYDVDEAVLPQSFVRLFTVNSASAFVAGLVPGITYQFRVRAENSAGLPSAYDVVVSTVLPVIGAGEPPLPPITAIRPTLKLPSHPLTSADQLEAGFPAGYQLAAYYWAFAPGSPAVAVAGLPGAAAPSQASLRTTGNQLALSAAAISPGTYQLTLQVQDTSGQFSLPLQTSIEMFSSSLDLISVYPNPWRADRDSGSPWITFSGLPSGATVKIYTLSAYWVRTLTPGGADIRWLLDNDAGSRVASGLYFYVIDDGQGNHRLGKVSILR